MPVGRLIDRLKLAPLVWGRCFSVVAADFEYASDALEEISTDLDASALREIEGLYSTRARDRKALLSGNVRNRPVGPFSSVLLEALSIRIRRHALKEEPLGGWLCHLREGDAVSAARRRFAGFCSTSEADRLSSRLQVYSARMAGRFATREDVLRLLLNGRSANDPRTIADTMTELHGAGIDGIVFDEGEESASTLVLRGCAVSQLRQTRQIEILWDRDRAIIIDDSTADQTGEPRFLRQTQA
jgi:hypothetical protein